MRRYCSAQHGTKTVRKTLSVIQKIKAFDLFVQLANTLVYKSHGRKLPGQPSDISGDIDQIIVFYSQKGLGITHSHASGKLSLFFARYLFKTRNFIKKIFRGRKNHDLYLLFADIVLNDTLYAFSDRKQLCSSPYVSIVIYLISERFFYCLESPVSAYQTLA